ncbi:hypothetical protein UF64_09660 [Thalassospira sp. HJ]|uniref:hypothetical protein n=1 Tax=Thalassospira sp. HJ TaxID=1616823 RepID=UPI0005CE2695|nr:hypothetical protein [Thalassospira sp. HJ]KJE34969.1 hypothetical protein UF64_09660 [Thalassospira sp. HJ]
MNIDFNELKKEIAGHRGAFELIVDESNLTELKEHFSACKESKIYPENLQFNYATRPILEIARRCLTLSCFNEKYDPVFVKFVNGQFLMICDQNLFGVRLQQEEFDDALSEKSFECAGYAIDSLVEQLGEMTASDRGSER